MRRPSGDQFRGGSNVPDTSQAVFLSYASQDAEVARRMCDALRAGGIEVWFDQSELKGGDAWDASIRKQIKSCALFIPVISKNTHARGEGYFRLEWKLAVDRSHLLASDLPFLLPVVVDDTLEQEDRVPERFREVQWMRLAAGADTDTFVAHVHRLLLPEAVPAPPARAPVPKLPSASLVAGNQRPPQTYRRFIPWIVGVLLILAVGYFGAEKLLGTSHAVATAEAAPDKSVAVLPFADMSEKKDQEYLSDGLSEELIDKLAQVQDLRVPARSSSFYFKGKQATIAEIAKTLGVSHILEGSVRKSGNDLRITAQLIRASNGYHVWSTTFDRHLDDIFKLEDEIASAVVSALKVSLKGDLTPEMGTKNAEAYSLYLQGRYMDRAAGNKEDHLKALGYMEKAIEIDPLFASAWADRSEMLDDLGRHTEARQSADQALKLNPKLPDAHTALARTIIIDDMDTASAEEQLQQTLALDPDNSWALAWVGTIAAYRGDFSKAIEILQRALLIDPVNVYRNSDLAVAFYYSGRYQDALDAFRRAYDLSPGWQGNHFWAAEILLVQGNAAGALAQLDLESDERVRTGCGCRVLMYDALGRKADANAALAELERTHAKDDAYGIGRVYASRNDLDRAFEWFDRAYREHDGDLYWIKVDPLLKTNVRADARYDILLRKLKLT